MLRQAAHGDVAHVLHWNCIRDASTARESRSTIATPAFKTRSRRIAMSALSERTALYRLYDADGVLLYIGISATPEKRLKVHRYDLLRRDWAQLVASQTFEWHRSRSAAQVAEEIAIRRERPPHNGTHNYPLAPFAPDRWPQIKEHRGRLDAIADLLRSEIQEGRWAAGEKIPSCARLAEATGVSATTANLAIRRLQNEGLLRLRRGLGLFVSSTPETNTAGQR
jgi:predicted GIY-YIG superfamily endonuclease